LDNKQWCLSGHRVYLVALNDSHISRYIKLSDDPELVSTMGWRPFGVDEKGRFLQTLQMLSIPCYNDGQFLAFSIISVGEDKPIGYVSLTGIDEDKSKAELGIAIMEKDYRGHGYGTEALRLALRYGFEDLGLALIGLTVFPFNQRATKAYEKAGFRRRGLLPKSWRLPTGEYVDMVLMEITQEQWAQYHKPTVTISL